MDLIALFRGAPGALTFAPDHLIFREGDAAGAMYVVLDGTVELIAHGRTVHTARPGSLIGEMGLIDDQPRSASAVAKTACTLTPVDRDRFATLVRETPEFALHVMQVLVRRLRSMDDHA